MRMRCGDDAASWRSAHDLQALQLTCIHSIFYCNYYLISNEVLQLLRYVNHSFNLYSHYYQDE